MIRCREVATLLSTDQVASQSVSRRIAVRFHLMMCRHCRRFARQLTLLKRVASDLGATFDQEVRADFVRRLHGRPGL
jgi:hypothetical protein